MSGENLSIEIGKSSSMTVAGRFHAGENLSIRMGKSSSMSIDGIFIAGENISIEIGKSSSMTIAGSDNYSSRLQLDQHTRFKLGPRSLYKENEKAAVVFGGKSNVTLEDSSKLIISGAILNKYSKPLIMHLGPLSSFKLYGTLDLDLDLDEGRYRVKPTNITIGAYSILTVDEGHILSLPGESFLVLGMQSSYTGDGGAIRCANNGIGITLEDQANLIVEGVFCLIIEPLIIPEQTTVCISPLDPVPPGIKCFDSGKKMYDYERHMTGIE